MTWRNWPAGWALRPARHGSAAGRFLAELERHAPETRELFQRLLTHKREAQPQGRGNLTPAG